MVQIYIIPNWFFGFGIFLEVFYALITLAVAAYSFKIYKLTYEKKCLWFGGGFIALSLSYISWVLINLYVSSINLEGHRVLNLAQISQLGNLGVLAHVFLFITGLTLLVFTTLKTRKEFTFYIILTLSLLGVIFSANKPLAFYFISAFLIFIVIVNYVKDYAKAKNKNTLLLIISLALILFGTIDLTLATIEHVHYVIGHVLYFLGYLGILISLLASVYSK